MVVTFDLDATAALEINIAGKHFHLAAGQTLRNGVASLEYHREADIGDWKLLRIELERNPV